MPNKPSVLITGASTGIGAMYADRFAKRGNDLVLVARDKVRMATLTDRLRLETGVAVDILQADLTDPSELAPVEARLRDDHRMGVLVNNAGTTLAGKFVDQSPDEIARIVSLNATAPVRLARAAAPRFVQAGQGAVVNISSVLGLWPEYGSTVYGATRVFVLFLSQSLHAELGPKGVYVQAVLPAAVRTEIWKHAGKDVDKLPAVMEVDELVDAALAGFDRRESVTIPALPDADQWADFEGVRMAMIPNFNQVHAAARYRHMAA
jgi:short-subunit dehydrogenase